MNNKNNESIPRIRDLTINLKRSFCGDKSEIQHQNFWFYNYYLQIYCFIDIFKFRVTYVPLAVLVRTKNASRCQGDAAGGPRPRRPSPRTHTPPTRHCIITCGTYPLKLTATIGLNSIYKNKF